MFSSLKDSQNFVLEQYIILTIFESIARTVYTSYNTSQQYLFHNLAVVILSIYVREFVI